VANHEKTRTPEEIAQDLERVRAKLMADVRALEERLDWRTHVRERPMTALGVAFSLGVVLGWI
jgi:hypothetical protein